MKIESGQELDAKLTSFFDPDSEQILRYSTNVGMAYTLAQRWIEDGGNVQIIMWNNGDIEVHLNDPVARKTYNGFGHDLAIAICRAIIDCYKVPLG